MRELTFDEAANRLQQAVLHLARATTGLLDAVRALEAVAARDKSRPSSMLASEHEIGLALAAAKHDIEAAVRAASGEG